MLKSLEIKDYALIDHIQIEFEKGLNIITGETGAGKSILLDAMSLLLGERASSEVVRKGAQKSFVEGIFEVEGNKKVKALLEENDIEFFPELIVRREISLKGSNRCFINDSPVPLNLIKEIGDLLVDLHGQHEHQSLLKTETHIDFVDDFFSNEKLLNEYQSLYHQLKRKKAELNELKNKEALLKEKKDIYQFQINEIDSVNPLPQEDEELIEELNVLENSENLLLLSDEIYNLIYESDNSVNDMLGEVKHKLSQLSSIDKSMLEAEGECESALTIIKELASTIRAYKSKIDVDPKEVEEKRERLAAINLLKKKYGGTLQKVIEYRQKIGNEFNLAENFSEEISRYEKELKELQKQAGEAAQRLSESRKRQSKKIEAEVKKVLSQLGITEPQFEVRITSELSDNNEDYILINSKKYLYSEKGIDEIEFFISTNPGEDLKPLVKVASGGEVSRIMLSLKTILAKNDKLPLLIFDEIDTGVSGRIAQKVGQALRDLASYHQIIAITHLPQIAAMANHHFVVEKTQEDNRSVSHIRKLNEEEHIREVAKLLSGEKLTDASIQSAVQLIKSSR
ncbi:DNA repair protein RecN [Ignavibacterium album JCM 16511]|uniref:DNA repair protein RecN n=1 Tax=Ignavibacterium album (strain DSM 19864 / JCM 16511 / NBRC 101810 / Mat9-16) TaxID=945713 RepID=I0AFU0_IGNAJ|nr:DNA repair protein RecN [Ignavibacterium album]AFH47847.1 DNA repair protein RecN [Ignavibacterium album JCM 16511]